MIGNFRHDDAKTAVLFFLNVGHGAQGEFSSPGAIRLLDAFFPHDHGAGRKIGALNAFHEFRGRDVLFVEHEHARVDDFSEIVGRHIGRHADCNAGGTVDEEVRKTAREHDGFFFALVKV